MYSQEQVEKIVAEIDENLRVTEQRLLDANNTIIALEGRVNQLKGLQIEAIRAALREHAENLRDLLTGVSP